MARLARRVAEQLRDHFVRDGADALRSDELDHLLAPFDTLRRVRGRPRVRENQSLHVPRGLTQDRERDVAAHRLSADHRLPDVERVEQIDDVASVIVDRPCRLHIATAVVESAELRGDDVPAALGERELPFPHARVDRKGVQQDQRTAMPGLRARHRVEIAKLAYCWHEPIVNVPPARVESERSTATVPAGVLTAKRSTSVCPRRPISTAPVLIAPRVCSAFNFATLTCTVTDRLFRSKKPLSAAPFGVYVIDPSLFRCARR